MGANFLGAVQCIRGGRRGTSALRRRERCPFSSLRCRDVQRLGSGGERGQGGPGGEENGDDGEGDTAMVIGAEVDDHFAENPLLPLFFYFSVLIQYPEAFPGFI